MTCDCRMGLSALAIKYRGHTDHPHDPADLLRCVTYCEQNGITVAALRKRMAGRSPEWDALLPHWERLTTLLKAEQEFGAFGKAPTTYGLMRSLLRAAR